MQQPPPPAFFDQQHASEYDQRNSPRAPLLAALHLLTSAVLANLPAAARLLCVGAGTGAELIYLAQKFPHWHFTAVEPSAAMLAVCRQKAETGGILARCTFHEGYLDSLPAGEPFHAATSLMVSQFILAPEARTHFFQAIAGRLHPGGSLVSADLAAGATAADYQHLLDVWLQLMTVTGVPAEKCAGLRTAYGRDVAVLPLAPVSAIIAAGGFATPVLFYQAGLIHAWHAKRT